MTDRYRLWALLRRGWALGASVFLLCTIASSAAGQTAPAAPTLAAPANGASLVQPIKLDWNPVVDPDGPIGSYTWQVATSSSFTRIILAGFTNQASDTLPAPTEDKVSGLPNGTYFWRVKATQMVGGATGSIDSPWSTVRSFTVTGLGPAPAGIPAFSAPAQGSQFHVREFFNIKWSAVPGAQYYLLEVDDEPTFSYPLTLTTTALTFGTHAEAGWGNAIPNVYYRVRAVSADNVRGLPSATLNVSITNTAPVPPPPSLLSPAPGATVTLPFTFDWSDTPNPQVLGYDLDVDTDPSFSGSFGVLLLQGLSRSDYMVASDLPPGNYFWRVRALHGDGFGPWTAGRAITVAAAPAAPPDFSLFAIIATPGNGYGGNSTQARVMLNQPAPAGGAVVTLASDMPQAEVPRTVTIPANQTDVLAPITTGPVPSNGIVGRIRAAYAGGWQQSSLGVLPVLYGTSLSDESVVGGTSLTGTVTLQSAAPAGGATIRLISSDTALMRVPSTVFIPAGGTDATFTVSTSAVTVPTRVIIETGTDDDGYRAPQAWLTLTPAGSPPPPASLSSLTLNPPNIAGGGTATGTVRLTSPAPAGGAIVRLSGSMEGEVVTPPSVTVPAGSLSADFVMTAPQVVTPHWVLIQGFYGTSGGLQAKLLRIDPGPAGPATLLAFSANGSDVIGGDSLRGTVGLVMQAPPGGGVVSLISDDPNAVQVPASIGIAEGTSTNSFTITTSPVSVATTVRLTASAGGISKTWFVNVARNPNAAPLLQSVSLNPTTISGGGTVTGTVMLSAPAPSGGTTVTLVTSNASVARPPGTVSIPGGATSANFAVTTFAVPSSTTVTISALLDTTRSASLTVTSGTTTQPTATGTLAAPSLISPASDARFAPGQNIVFDWSDVAGAASYTIQIDDQDTFASPLIVNQTVAASQFSSNTLPTTRMWWRVRAIDSAGVTGAWSSVRRFEVKN